MQNDFSLLHLKTCLELEFYVFKKIYEVLPGLPILNVSGTFISHLKTTIVSLDVGMLSDSQTLLWVSQFPFSVVL